MPTHTTMYGECDGCGARLLKKYLNAYDVWDGDTIVEVRMYCGECHEKEQLDDDLAGPPPDHPAR